METIRNNQPDIIIDEVLACYDFHNYNLNWERSFPAGNISTLDYIYEGNFTITADGKEYTAHENSIVFIPYNLSHINKSNNKPIKFYGINFTSLKFENVNLPIITEVNMPSYVKNLFFQARNSFAFKKTGYIQELRYLIYEILHIVMYENLNEKSKERVKQIKKSLDYIEKNYTNPELNIEEIAKQSYITSTYFRVLFKKIYSVSPIKYINSLRIDYAKMLLLLTGDKINTISEKSGYSNICYFMRLFKEIVGCTPLEFRNMNSNGATAIRNDKNEYI